MQPLTGPGGRFQISSGGGVQPTWGPSSRELFYAGGQALISARVAVTGAELTVVRRDTLMSMSASRSAYDVAPDGEHFVMSLAAGSIGAPIVVVGWADEVRERLAAAARK